MDLFTRCAQCDTAFRVTTPQLQASGGQVRCGHCGAIFDAFATLTAQEPKGSSKGLTGTLVQPTPQGQPMVESGARPVPAMAPDPPKAQSQSIRPDPAASLYEWEFRMPETPQRTLLWLIPAFVLTIVLAAQAAYAFRSEIMIYLPQTRAYYVRLCESLGCTIGLAKLSNYLHIEASDLKVVDPSRPSEILLMLSVRNRAPVGLAYPAFELTLTDSQEQAIARRVFLPAEYLPSPADAAGFKAGTELPIQLYLDTGALRASGYRLYLFYP
jgi:predicted Zn finger-like uncharacterized protein